MMTISELEKDHNPEITAIILICRVFLKTAREEELSAFFEQHKIDWPLFYKMVCAHHIRPIVNNVISGLKISNETTDKLLTDCRQITMRNFEYYRELLQLNTLFVKENITTVPYKGCIFSIQFYNDISLREFSDIDFLIKPDVSNIEAITKLLTAQGYSIGDEIPEEFKKFHFDHVREFKFFLYSGGKRKFLAEFHSSLSDPVFDTSMIISNEYLFADLNEIDLNNNKIKTLSPTKHLITLFTHHGIREQWTSLKNIMDIAQGIKNDAVKWNIIMECSHTYRFNKVLKIGLNIVNDLLGLEPNVPYDKPKTITPWLKKLFSRHLYKPTNTWRNNLLLKIKSKDSFGDSMKMVFNHVRYIAMPSVLDYKFLKLPVAFNFLYIFIKPIRMLKMNFNKNSQQKNGLKKS